MVEELGGVITPLVTPLDKNEDLDVEGLVQLLRHVILGGVDGIFLHGTAGEFPLLNDQVFEESIQITRKKVDEGLPVYVGVSAASTEKSIKRAKVAKDLGADILVSTTPYYYDLSQEEIKKHFTIITNKVDAPLLLYNIPDKTHNLITIDTLRDLAKNERIIGIKASNTDFGFFLRTLEVCNQESLYIFQGKEEAGALSLIAGADGAVMGMSNLVPNLASSIFEKVMQNKIENALKIQNQVNQLTEMYNYGSWLPSIKQALAEKNICKKFVKSPLSELTHKERNKLKDFLKNSDLIKL